MLTDPSTPKNRPELYIHSPSPSPLFQLNPGSPFLGSLDNFQPMCSTPPMSPMSSLMLPGNDQSCAMSQKKMDAVAMINSLGNIGSVSAFEPISSKKRPNDSFEVAPSSPLLQNLFQSSKKMRYDLFLPGSPLPGSPLPGSSSPKQLFSFNEENQKTSSMLSMLSTTASNITIPVPTSPVNVAFDNYSDKSTGSKRTRVRVGNYKKRFLLELLSDFTKHRKCDSLVVWPDMNVVYFCEDYTRLTYKGKEIKNIDEHCFKKYVGFSHGSYTQSKLVINDANFILRQSRCAGVRKCETCSMVCRSRRPTCNLRDCDGTLVNIQCPVTLYYLFPVSPINNKKPNPNDRRRYIVCIPDKELANHSHEIVSHEIDRYESILFD